jgi:acyl-CoA synthetase (AMP-forming)/AMP-acid ligase II
LRKSASSTPSAAKSRGDSGEIALLPGEAPDEAAVIAFAREKLAGYKVPKSVTFIDEVPKSPLGKLSRRALRGPFWWARSAGSASLS